MVLKLDRTSVIDHAPTPRCCSQGLFARAQPQAQRDAAAEGERAGSAPARQHRCVSP